MMGGPYILKIFQAYNLLWGNESKFIHVQQGLKITEALTADMMQLGRR